MTIPEILQEIKRLDELKEVRLIRKEDYYNYIEKALYAAANKNTGKEG